MQKAKSLSSAFAFWYLASGLTKGGQMSDKHKTKLVFIRRVLNLAKIIFGLVLLVLEIIKRFNHLMK